MLAIAGAALVETLGRMEVDWKKKRNWKEDEKEKNQNPKNHVCGWAPIRNLVKKLTSLTPTTLSHILLSESTTDLTSLSPASEGSERSCP